MPEDSATDVALVKDASRDDLRGPPANPIVSAAPMASRASRTGRGGEKADPEGPEQVARPPKRLEPAGFESPRGNDGAATGTLLRGLVPLPPARSTFSPVARLRLRRAAAADSGSA